MHSTVVYRYESIPIMESMSTLLDFDITSTDWNGPHEMIRCKRALHPSVMKPMSYSLNPYSGCEHGCIYCYAPGHTHSDISTWRVVRVKTNIVDRLAKEIDNTEGMIGIGTVTDPYQAAEGRFMLTRMCLELLHRKRRSVFIITKSSLVTRDIDILSDMDAAVAVTVTNPDDRISRMTEPGAPLPGERLKAVKELVDNGIDTMVFIAPVLSTLEGREDELMRRIADTGVRKVYIDLLNVRATDTTRMDRMGITSSTKAEKRLLELNSLSMRIERSM